MPKVVVYSTEWCPWCVRLKDWLKQNKIKFEEKDIEKDEEAGAEMLGKTGGDERVPVTDVGGTVIKGFDVPALKKALKIK
jgi:glutaredoxin-like YruB-family protein